MDQPSGTVHLYWLMPGTVAIEYTLSVAPRQTEPGPAIAPGAFGKAQMVTVEELFVLFSSRPSAAMVAVLVIKEGVDSRTTIERVWVTPTSIVSIGQIPVLGL